MALQQQLLLKKCIVFSYRQIKANFHNKNPRKLLNALALLIRMQAKYGPYFVFSLPFLLNKQTATAAKKIQPRRGGTLPQTVS